MIKIFILGFVLIAFGVANGLRGKHMNVSQTLDFLLANHRYDKRLRPDFGGPPIMIAVNFFIKSMGPVSDNDQSYGLDCYFRQHWYDWRLKFDKLPGLEELSMSWLFLDRVWKPDTYFVNGKKSYLHRITVPNKFLRLRYDGFITYSMRLTISASCPMYLRKFPLDAQRCPLIVGSYGYSDKDLVYKWTEEAAIGLQEGVEIAQFDLVNITTQGAKTIFKGGLPYSTLQADFWLKRHTGYFMLQVYIPCGLIVVCSWISFWIDPDAVYVPCGLIVLSSWVSFWIDPDDVAARVALGVTTVLSLTTMGFGGRSQLPKVSYWTALDWFVILCFTYVFSVMIEYAVVNLKDKFKKDLKKMIEKQNSEESKKSDEEILKAQIELTSALRKNSVERKRCASLPPSASKAEEGSHAVTVEVKRSSSRMERRGPFCRNRVKRVVTFLRPLRPQLKCKSITDLRMHGEKEEKETKVSPRIVVTKADEECQMEPGDVVLDVESKDLVEEKEKKKTRSMSNFIKKLNVPRSFLKSFKTLPINLIADANDFKDPPKKFSKLDVRSRRNFPITFVISLVVYLLAFTYYLTDDNPETDSELIVENN